ncbi:hypothetical protein L249_0212 [Ophiocordyceps polyrhachis-furcata BCC 54312]|uniref:DUF3835 domain-containing protein n=1 Tax=Ophiocordyceps polyrhachis-furcata BCC 54312 TaxID=1330021 RepID=A0A367LD75_9HYPO|nr:hypothetical protein L249_0212 [Ophiocordyceps polyrhachis-furcata BCC 54312]
MAEAGDEPKIQNSIQHWLTWDAEYEALKEEVEAIPDNQPEELHRIHKNYEGDLLRHRELDDIFGLQAPRSKRQIVNVLQRRIDYVTQNLETLRKQLHAELSGVEGTAHDVEPNITDVVEQLDDDGNVVSFHLSRSGDALPQVCEALEKAGVDVLGGEKPSDTSSPLNPSKPQPTTPCASSSSSSSSSSTSPSAPTGNAKNAPPRPSTEMSPRAQRVDEIMNRARQQESISNQDPVIPVDEDSEDAQLRREMIQYGLRDVGAVVAELKLEEGEDSDFDEDMNDTDDDAEDRYGRSTGRLVSDDYRQRMLDLERKHGVKSRFTLSTDGDDRQSESGDDEGIGRIKVNCQVSPSASKSPPHKSSIKDKQSDAKKGVRFAQSLDVAPDDEPAASATEERAEPVADPLGDIVERAGPGDTIKPASKPRAPHRSSWFKQAREMEMAASSEAVPLGPLDAPSRLMDESMQDAPSWPQGSTVVEQLVEKEPSSSPCPPDELDDSMSCSSIADEHQRLRKRFIHRQGGFLQKDASPVEYLDGSEETAAPVSRFKAARLSRR